MKNKKIMLLMLIIILLLITNVYAWFIFNNNANVSIETTIKSWDIDFIDENKEVTETIEFDIESMYPGMEKAEKNIIIRNNGDVAADIEYKVLSIRVLDEEKNVGENCTEEEIMEYIESLPFDIEIDITKKTLDTNEDAAEANISVTWEFEDTTKPGEITEKDIKDTEWGIKAYEYSQNPNAEKNNFSMKIQLLAKQKNG